MSLLTNPLQSGLLLQQAVLPYTFTTGELDSLKAKLQAAESQMMQQPNKQASMLPMSATEIRTLLRMIDMTYLQGLSGSGHYVQDCTGAASAMTPMIHNPSQLQQTLTSGNATALQQLGANGINGLGTNPSSLNSMSSLSALGGINQQQQSLNGMLGGGGGGGNNHNGSNGNNHGSTKNPPPANYICHKCNVVGHWIQECPLNTQQQQDYTKPPPANYICHRCGVPGHWIKNCPTNGNPTFDNKPHLKVIKTQEGGTTTVMTSSDGTVNTVNSNDNSSNGQVNTASQPPSKKRRLNQM